MQFWYLNRQNGITVSLGSLFRAISVTERPLPGCENAYIRHDRPQPLPKANPAPERKTSRFRPNVFSSIWTRCKHTLSQNEFSEKGTHDKTTQLATTTGRMLGVFWFCSAWYFFLILSVECARVGINLLSPGDDALPSPDPSETRFWFPRMFHQVQFNFRPRCFGGNWALTTFVVPLQFRIINLLTPSLGTFM